MTDRRSTYKTTAEADELIARINAARPLDRTTVADAINYALRFTAANDTEVRTMEKITEILYQYEADDAAMFGPDAEIGEVDTRASYNAFEDAVQKALKAAYPTARISVQSGPSKLRVNWMTDTEEVSVVEDIIHEVWESWNWLVAA